MAEVTVRQPPSYEVMERNTFNHWLFFCFPIKSAHAQWEKVFAIILYINNTDHQGSSISWAKLINGSLAQNNIILC